MPRPAPAPAPAPASDLGPFTPFRTFRNEWLLLLGALLALGGLLAYTIVHERETIGQKERDHLAKQAQIIHDSLERQFDSVNRALLNIREEWPARSVRDGSVRSAIPRLKAFVEAMPGVRGLFIVDADGILRATNFTQLIGTDVRERVYFQQVLKNPKADILYLSPPFRTALNVWGINMVRMIPGPRGEFAGLVAATLDPEEFKLVLRSVNYAPDVWSALAHGGGLMFLVEPERSDQLGMNLAQPGSFFSRHMASGAVATVLSGTVYRTGEQRLLAQYTIQPPDLKMDNALVVAIGRDLNALYAPWRKDALTKGLLLAILSLSTLCALYLLQWRKLKGLREIQQAQDALRLKTEELQHYFDNALNLLCIADFEGRFVKLNPAWENVLGHKLADLEGQLFQNFLHPEDRAQTLAALDRLRQGEKVIGLCNRYRHLDGSYHDIEWQAVRQGDLIFADARDITQERRNQQAMRDLNTRLEAQSETLRSLAFLDGLTGVANRRRFDESLQTEWRQCLRQRTPLGLLLLDVDHFKLYNDHYGHQAGDACLQVLARTLLKHIGRPHDLLARYGGEAFVCLLPHTDAPGSQAKAEALRQAVMELGLPHQRSPVTGVVTLSIGVVSWVPTDQTTSEQMLLAADEALYAAKRAGRNRIACASPYPVAAADPAGLSHPA